MSKSSQYDLSTACADISTCSEAFLLAERTLSSAGIESARFEAQLIVAIALQVNRTAVIARTAPDPNICQKAELSRLLSERIRRVPLAYLRGNQEFYGLTFEVSPATLIPRPETELLVDFAIKALAETSSDNYPVMIDVGTGSGCISIAAMKHSAGARAVAVDISGDAISVARLNAHRIGVADRLRFVRADTLDGIKGKVRLIVSNPPYIASGQIAELQPEVVLHEPRKALDGGIDGLVLIRNIVASAAKLLEQGGWLAVECAQGQAQDVQQLFVEAGFEETRIVNDLAGIQRMVCGRCSLSGFPAAPSEASMQR